MEQKFKMKKAVVIILLIFLLIGCKSVEYITPSLPEFSPVIPERPELLEIPKESEIPKEANINLVLLMGYAESLENVIESWERFYNELTNLYQTK